MTLSPRPAAAHERDESTNVRSNAFTRSASHRAEEVVLRAIPSNGGRAAEGPSIPAAWKLGLRLLGGISTELAGRTAGRLFITPPRSKPSLDHAALFASARAFQVRLGRLRIAAWAWGEGPPVLLLHGWGGRALQFRALVPGLVASGFSAVALEAPGHGASDGATSSLVEFAEALFLVGRETGDAHAVVTHSLGGAAATMALANGLRARRAVFLAPPADAAEAFARFAALFELSPAVVDRAFERLEDRLHVSFARLNTRRLAPRMTTDLLVVHDRGDADVPYADGAAVAESWPGARLLTTEGLGHRRLLRDPEVVSAVTAFVRDGVCPPSASERRAPC